MGQFLDYFFIETAEYLVFTLAYVLYTTKFRYPASSDLFLGSILLVLLRLKNLKR